MFHRIFPPKFSPNFRCVFFSAVIPANATEKRPPKNSARKSIAEQSDIQSADVTGLETTQRAHLRSSDYTPVGNSYLPIPYFFKLFPWKLTDTDTDP